MSNTSEVLPMLNCEVSVLLVINRTKATLHAFTFNYTGASYASKDGNIVSFKISLALLTLKGDGSALRRHVNPEVCYTKLVQLKFTCEAVDYFEIVKIKVRGNITKIIVDNNAINTSALALNLILDCKQKHLSVNPKTYCIKSSLRIVMNLVADVTDEDQKKIIKYIINSTNSNTSNPAIGLICEIHLGLVRLGKSGVQALNKNVKSKAKSNDEDGDVLVMGATEFNDFKELFNLN